VRTTTNDGTGHPTNGSIQADARLAKANRFWRGMTITLVVLALGFCTALLAKDAQMETIPRLPLHVLSALSLLLIGGAFLLVQPMMCLRPKEFLKNVLLAATFILWGIVELMPQNALSIRLGNLVVALFVVDLSWATLLSVSTVHESRATAHRKSSKKNQDSDTLRRVWQPRQ
jgi:hypothetical protein